MEKFRLTTEFLSQYKDRKPPFGFNGLGALVYERTYSRVKADGVNEQWWETIARVVEGCYNMQKRHIEHNGLGWNPQKAQKSAQEMYDRMWSMKFLPPGRGLWAMGSTITEERECFAALNNCGFVSTRDIAQDFAKPFTFLMDASMLGCGVGFDTLGAGIISLREPKPVTETFIIPDSREGWVESVGKLLKSYAKGGPTMKFDYSLIRARGLPIRGFGGTASGPEPLEALHESLRVILNKAIYESVTKRTITDIMNMIGCCVVAGNVRRTAELAMDTGIDLEFLELKNYDINPDRMAYGWSSNNSINIKIGSDYTIPAGFTQSNGEPGYIWMENAKTFSRMNNGPDYKDAKADGPNPCGEQTLESFELCCVTGDTPLQTVKGIQYIKNVIDKSIPIWNGEQWSEVTPFKAAVDKAIYRVTFSDGSYLDVSDNHRFSAKRKTGRKFREYTTLELQPGDFLPEFSLSEIKGNSEPLAYTYGVVCGDGYIDNDKSMVALYGAKKALLPYFESIGGTVYKTQHPEAYKDSFNRVSLPMLDLALVTVLRRSDAEGLLERLSLWDSESLLEFIAGYIDTDGSISYNPNAEGHRLFGSENKMRVMQLLLRRIGVDHSSVYELKSQQSDVTIAGIETHRNYPQWVCQIPSFESGKIPTKLKKLKHIAPRHRANNAHPGGQPIDRARKQKVVSVDYLKQDTVYCFTEPITHMGVFGNVITYQCLVETFPHRCESLSDYQRTLKFAYLYAKTVTLGKTHWAETNRILLRNRRIGCSMSGIAQFVTVKGINTLREWCEEGYKTLQYYDKVYADWLCIPKSIKLTSVKPSGTVSLLAGATPGIHYPESRWYLRRVRLAKDSPLVKPLQGAGYIVEPCVGQEDSTVVVAIPVKIHEPMRTLRQVTMWEQLEMAAFMQRYWADNQVSVTITFDPETEGPHIANALNYYQYRLKGVSFLPRLAKGAFAQMPYEEITEEAYNELACRLNDLDFDSVKGNKAEVERFCDGEACVI